MPPWLGSSHREVTVWEHGAPRSRGAVYPRSSSSRVHDTFRTLTVESGEVSRVLTEAAALTGLRVVLEDLGHRALSFAGDPATTVLKDWTARSRQVPGT